jgi:hypothetical protein
MLFKHGFSLEGVQSEVDEIKEDLEKRISSVSNGFIITFDVFQTNCFWFEPKSLCKSPDGNGTCHKRGLCPILWKLRRV